MLWSNVGEYTGCLNQGAGTSGGSRLKYKILNVAIITTVLGGYSKALLFFRSTEIPCLNQGFPTTS